jgi:DNA-binding CsgD family transcriptional regulator
MHVFLNHAKLCLKSLVKKGVLVAKLVTFVSSIHKLNMHEVLVMENLTILQKQSISFSPDVKNICTPLFAQYDINAFSYARLYPNKKLIYLSTDSNWLEFYYNNEFHTAKTLLKSPVLLQNEFTLWDAISDNPVVVNTKKYFNLIQGMTYIVKGCKHTDIFNFSSTNLNFNLYNWFINNIDIIRYFVLYFSEKSNSIIHILEKINQPAPVLNSVLTTEKNNQTLKREEFLNKITPSQFSILYHGKLSVLSFREYQCMCLLASGFTAKEAAKLINLSPRTIEFYLTNIKKKVGYRTTFDLIKIFYDNNIPNYFSLYKDNNDYPS